MAYEIVFTWFDNGVGTDDVYQVFYKGKFIKSFSSKENAERFIEENNQKGGLND